jgi:hypothetical protein
MGRKLTPGLRERCEVESWSSSDFTHAVWVMAVSAKKRRYDSKDVIFGVEFYCTEDTSCTTLR